MVWLMVPNSDGEGSVPAMAHRGDEGRLDVPGDEMHLLPVELPLTVAAA